MGRVVRATVVTRICRTPAYVHVAHHRHHPHTCMHIAHHHHPHACTLHITTTRIHACISHTTTTRMLHTTTSMHVAHHHHPHAYMSHHQHHPHAHHLPSPTYTHACRTSPTTTHACCKPLLPACNTDNYRTLMATHSLTHTGMGSIMNAVLVGCVQVDNPDSGARTVSRELAKCPRNSGNAWACREFLRVGPVWGLSREEAASNPAPPEVCMHGVHHHHPHNTCMPHTTATRIHASCHTPPSPALNCCFLT